MFSDALSVRFLDFQMFNKDTTFMEMMETFRKNFTCSSLWVSLILQSRVC